MSTNNYKENMAFEAEVRRVAEAVWQLEPGHCQPEHYSNNPVVRELDGLAHLRDVTHLLMVTVSTKLEKVKGDVEKLNAAAKIEARRGVPVSMWLITKHQLDAQHVSYARQRNVTVLTLDSFRNRFFDGRNYLSKRRVAPFGSARNLSDGTISVAENEYVELPMTVETYNEALIATQGKLTVEITVQEIVDRLIRGEVVVMVAPFGAGKSLTTREIFLTLMRQHLKHQIAAVPLAINLREHWGQIYGDEILERHARSIGFSPKENLTIAWRAGIVTILIDGFDEVASQVVARGDKVEFMREARLQALQGARDIISNAPSGVGVLVCGRDHYFDNLKEMTHALGIHNRPFNLVRLGEFTEEQAMTFLRKNRLSYSLPDWLPRKPLILGYLAHRGLLEGVLNIDASHGFGYAWDTFLDLICAREAALERAAMDPETVRRVLERLASGVRSTFSGTGPITERELANAYQLETGQVPGEGVIAQLQRLPGLTSREQDPGARSFIDEDMLAALQGSALARYILGDVTEVTGRSWLDVLSDKGIAMASYMLKKNGADHSTVIAAGLRNQGSDGLRREKQVAGDSVMIALEMAREQGQIDFTGVWLDGASLGTIDLEDMIIYNLQLQECIINEVILGPRGATSSIVFRRCNIRRVSGSSSEQGLPQGMFVDCDVDEFDDMSTNSAVLRSNLPPTVKALVTVLRKLYIQAGAGRRLNALKRGISNTAVLNSIDQVVQILASEDMIAVNNQVAHPIRRQQARVIQILNAPNLSDDPILEKVRAIQV